MTETQAREAICLVGRSLFERRLVHATAGNISVRLDDGFLITPTDACLGQLDPAQMARVDAQGRQISGARASKTLVLHQRIYQAALPFDAAGDFIQMAKATVMASELGPSGALRGGVSARHLLEVLELGSRGC